MKAKFLIFAVVAFVCGCQNAYTGINASDTDVLTSMQKSMLKAAAEGRSEDVIAFLGVGVDVDAADRDGNTSLHMAAGNGHSEAIKVLSEAGADVNAADTDGNTPLHFAAQKDHAEAASALLEVGAYLNATSNDGFTPLDIARRHKKWSVVQLLENPPIRNLSTPGRVFEKAWRSVVLIEINSGRGLGSGVIIKPNIVATNCHVEGGDIVVYKASQRTNGKGETFSATIRHLDIDNDFCLLDVPGLSGIPVNVRKYDNLRIGENVYAIGAPRGFTLTLTEGLISQLSRIEGIRQIQTNVAISPGSSGSGLFDQDGNLVGFITSKIAEGIGFAIPADIALD